MLAELAAAVRDRSADPETLVAEAYRRIEQHNPTLNAVVALRPQEEVLAEASTHSRAGALAGLPLLVKDMARAAGMRTSFGSALFNDAPIDEVDDIYVARLRQAGAILIGKTNTPAFGHTAFTSNLVFGATGNPWNPERSPGGSSGGSAAALMAGMTPLATTSDGGGSTRGPASATGLVGYKPTMGAIGRNFTPRWLNYSTMGVSGRTVADCIYEASVVLGPARGDVLSLPAGSVNPSPIRPSKVLAIRTLRSGVDAGIEAAFDELLDQLAVDGLEVERVASPVDPEELVRLWFISSAAELAQSLSPYRDRWDSLDPSLAFQLRYGESVSAADYLAAQRVRYETAGKFDDLLNGDTVIVTPTCNATSWPKEGPLPTEAGGVRSTSISMNTMDFNFTGHPAINVPLGADDSGVPFGVQIVGPRFADGLAFGLAAVIEQIRPWATVARGYDTWDRFVA